MAYNEDSSASGHDEPWIQWFCGLKGHEMFCEVERAYIEDGFNLYGLRACVPNFSDCLDLILDRIGPDDSDDSHLTQSACTLYGLIHARYIITAHGLDAMYNKYAAKEFGTCPLVQCQGQPVLPVGLKDEVGVDTVKVFCPKCQCVYHPPPSRSRGGSGAVDGASFGTTFPHLFLMTFNNLVPETLTPDQAYVPRVFGFRVHQSARQQHSLLQLSSAQSNANNLRAQNRDFAQAAAANTMTSELPTSTVNVTARNPPPINANININDNACAKLPSIQNEIQRLDANPGNDQDEKISTNPPSLSHQKLSIAAATFNPTDDITFPNPPHQKLSLTPATFNPEPNPPNDQEPKTRTDSAKSHTTSEDGAEFRPCEEVDFGANVAVGENPVENSEQDGNKLLKQNISSFQPGNSKRKGKTTSAGSASSQIESNENGSGKGNGDYADGSYKNKAKRQKRPSNGVT